MRCFFCRFKCNFFKRSAHLCTASFRFLQIADFLRQKRVQNIRCIGTIHIMHQPSDRVIQIAELSIDIHDMCSIAKQCIVQLRNPPFHMVKRQSCTKSVVFCDEYHISIYQIFKVFSFIQQRPVQHTAVESCSADSRTTVCTLNFNIHHAAFGVHCPNVQLDRAICCTFIFHLRLCPKNANVIPLQNGIQNIFHRSDFFIQRFGKEVIIHQPQPGKKFQITLLLILLHPSHLRVPFSIKYHIYAQKARP